MNISNVILKITWQFEFLATFGAQIFFRIAIMMFFKMSR
uniref:Uncharacterized protein n=1 Tax=Lepeophtheirus salmonis TaxID=72036 RepID=A0A0K2TEV4_LEPSM